MPLADRELPAHRVDLYQPATAQQHPLARMEQVAIDDLRAHRLCGLLPGHARALSIDQPDWSSFYESNCFDAVLPIVTAGHAAVLAPGPSSKVRTTS